MAEEKSSAYCQHCKAQRMVTRPGTNHVLHLLLTIITFGLWALVWVFGTIKIGGWRCTVCGTPVPLLSEFMGGGDPAPEAQADGQDVPNMPRIGKSGIPEVF